jgi:hypothetical protein
VASVAGVLGALALSLRPIDAEGDARRGALVARVGGETIGGARLAAFLYDRQRESWLRAVDDLLDETIAIGEAERLGVGVPPDVVAASVEKEAAAREAELHRLYGDDVSLEAEIRRAYGLDVAAWKRGVLEPRIRIQHLLMRIVRLDTRRRPRVRVRVIVASDPDRAARILQKLRSGADFSLTAVQESIDPTAATGGVLPAVARGDLAWPDVEARLFAAEPGRLVGPVEVTDDGPPTWQIYKVIEHVAPWEGTRSELLRRLEEDLKAHPLERPEFERWRARVRRDFGVQVFSPDGEPLVVPK